MKTKMLLATLAVALSPTLAMAAGCGYGKSEQVTMTCAPGAVYDAETHACVPSTS